MVRAIRLICAISTVALIVALTSFPAAAQSVNERPSRVVPFIVMTLLLAGALFLGYLNFKSNQPFDLSRVTSLPSDQILERLIGHYTIEGWRVSSHTGRVMTLHRHSDPHLLIAFLLLFLGILPGLLYLFFGGRDLTVAVRTRHAENGMAEVEVLGNSRSDGSYRVAREVLDGLP